MEILLLLVTTALVYALCWGAAWLIARVVPVPGWLRPALPWLLLQSYLVIGLFWTGDLPGAPAAVVKLAALAGGISLVLGLVAAWWARRRDQEARFRIMPAAWLLAGLLPWVAALLAEALA